jgi:predicted PurR-regulated permease PerM
MFRIPADLSLGLIYVPPFFLDAVAGVILAYLVAQVLNRTGLSRFFWHPPLAFLALVVLMGSLFGILVLPP